MLNYFLTMTGMMSSMTPDQILIMNDLLISGLALILVAVWLLAGDLIKAWMKAWWVRGEILLEWTKTRSWFFHVVKRSKGRDEFRALPDGRPVEMRRNAIGTAPHKLQMALFSSEFGAVVSPTEIAGTRYYSPGDIQYGTVDKDGEFHPAIQPSSFEKLRHDNLLKKPEEDLTGEEREELQELSQMVKMWEDALPYVPYPSSTVTPDEFVMYQSVNTDPSTTESYSEFRELETKQEMMNPLNNIADHIHWLIPLIFVLAIAYQIVSQQNLAGNAAGDLAQCAREMADMARTCDPTIAEKYAGYANKTVGAVIK